MLHCVKKAQSGGANQFSDGFRVAEQLKVERPDVFRLLTKTKINYTDHGKTQISYNLRCQWPVIQ